MKQLTLKEAIEQGYKYYGFDNDEDQNLNELHDDIFEEELSNIEKHAHLRLFSKEYKSPIIKPEDLKQHVIEYLEAVFEEEFYNEEGDLYEKCMNKVDFKSITDQINKPLLEEKYYFMSNIKLIKG